MSRDVFISYSSKDSVAAQAVCKAIELSGMPCWIAPRDISPGREWSGEIIDALNACRAIVLIFSSSSNDSPQVIREVERGVNKRLPILVFRIEDTPLSKAMEYFLSVPHWFDAHSGPIETHLPPLTQGLAQLLGKMAPEPAPEPSPVISPLENLPREVTFLFSDIEGSTKLWENYPEQMRLSLARHDALLRRAIEQAGGQVFKTVGDAFCAVFASATNAVEAALQAQLLLFSEPWPAETPLKVRVALHRGEAERRDSDFYGPTLNRVARILATGHGGQVLLSRVTTELTQDQLPANTTLLPLGEHHLKDLGQPERIFQLLHPQLSATFPPLRSMDNPELRHNLPLQVTSFVGRDTQIADVKELLTKTRLLTLMGLGGSGKTRLALQVAADLSDRNQDGVWLVELAPLTEPGHVPSSVAAVLGVKEEPGKALLQTLLEYLKEKELLLILDNGEHLISACAKLADTLIRQCPRLRILATSREAMGIAGERTYHVPPLSLPDPKQSQTPESLLAFETVQLFVDRASTAKTDFAMTATNAPALASICHRLDGIPLAIELAAARVRSMPVEQIEQRLDQRFRLLTGGSRTALPRQQTLRALIDWSYDLLEENQKALLCRLSVFLGGWTLEAAEGVCSGSGFPPAAETATPNNGGKGGLGQGGTPIEDWEMLDLLTSLCDKSLVVYSEGEGFARYRLLETLRQYSRDRLQESGESALWEEQHLAHFSGLAEEAEPQMTGPEQQVWLDRLEMEHDNLRAALERSSDLRLAGALVWFWQLRGYLSEGREQLSRALTAGIAAEPQARAKALDGAGVLACDQGDYAAARALYEESLALLRELGDQEGIAASLNNLGNVALDQGDYAAARSLHEESLAIRRVLGDRRGIAVSLNNLGNVACNQNDYVLARALIEESLMIRRERGDRWGIANSLNNLGNVVFDLGDYAAARTLYEESLVYRRELGERVGIATSLNNLGDVATCLHDYVAARALYTESLTLFHELGDRSGLAYCLEGLASATATDAPVSAALLWGAAEHLREELGSPLSPTERSDQEQRVTAARAAGDTTAFALAWAQGREQTLEQVITLALEK